MSNTTSPLTSTPTTHPSAARATRGPRLRTGLLALILTVVAVLGIGTSHASAYTWEQASGSHGGVAAPQRVQAQYVSGYVNGVMSTYAGLRVPGLYVTRSNAASGAQIVMHGLVVEQWMGSYWVTKHSVTYAPQWIPAGVKGIWLAPQTFTLGSGTYRVVSAVIWGNSAGRRLGSIGLDYNGYDYECRTGFRCTPGYGWVTI